MMEISENYRRALLVSHLRRDGTTATVCGEPWQQWQAPVIDCLWVVNPVQPSSTQPVRQCLACMRQAGYGEARSYALLYRTDLS